MNTKISTLSFEDLIYIEGLLQKELDRLQSGANIEGNHYHEDWMNELNAAKPHIERFEQFKKEHLLDESRWFQIIPQKLNTKTKTYSIDNSYHHFNFQDKTYKSLQDAIIAVLDYYGIDDDMLLRITSNVDGIGDERCEGFIVNDEDGLSWIPTLEDLAKRGYHESK